MTSLNLSTRVAASAEQMYELICDPSQLATILPQVQAIKVLRRKSARKQLTEWLVDIEGIIVRWVQEDSYGPHFLTWNFRMIEGDYQDYYGHWNCQPISEHRTLLRVDAHFKWGLPVLERYYQGVLDRKAQHYYHRMVAALRLHVMKTVRTHG